MTFAVGQRVRCKKRGCEHEVMAVSTGPFGEKLMLHDGYDWLEASLVDLVIPDTPPTLRPCFVCSTPTAGEVCEQHKPVACVPEPQICACQPYGDGNWCAYCIKTGRDKEVARLVADMNVRAFREMVAAMSGNPVARCVPDDQPESYDARRARKAAERNPGQGRWGVVGGQQSWVTDEETIYATQDAEGLWSFTSWSSGHDTSGIDRAVRNLSQVEHRVGAARWKP
jgi:hypothetical protein